VPLAPYAAVLIGLHVLSNAWIAAGLYHIAIVLCLARGGGKGLASALLSGWEARPGVSLFLVCATGGVFLYFLWPTVRLEDMDLRTTTAAWGLGGVWLWIFGVYFSTAGAVLEEIFWRFSLTAKTSQPHWRDAAFAGYHVLVLAFFIRPQWIAVVFLILFATAWIWRITANRTGGLLVPITSHVVADLSVVLALGFLLTARG
jgi:membrane protease YdiL (CAAX protease family)